MDHVLVVLELLLHVWCFCQVLQLPLQLLLLLPGAVCVSQTQADRGALRRQ